MAPALVAALALTCSACGSTSAPPGQPRTDGTPLKASEVTAAFKVAGVPLHPFGAIGSENQYFDEKAFETGSNITLQVAVFPTVRLAVSAARRGTTAFETPHGQVEAAAFASVRNVVAFVSPSIGSRMRRRVIEALTSLGAKTDVHRHVVRDQATPTAPYRLPAVRACLSTLGQPATDVTGSTYSLPFPNAVAALRWSLSTSRAVILLFARNRTEGGNLERSVRRKLASVQPAATSLRRELGRRGNVVWYLEFFKGLAENQIVELRRCLS